MFYWVYVERIPENQRQIIVGLEMTPLVLPMMYWSLHVFSLTFPTDFGRQTTVYQHKFKLKKTRRIVGVFVLQHFKFKCRPINIAFADDGCAYYIYGKQAVGNRSDNPIFSL